MENTVSVVQRQYRAGPLPTTCNHRKSSSVEGHFELNPTRGPLLHVALSGVSTMGSWYPLGARSGIKATDGDGENCAVNLSQNSSSVAMTMGKVCAASASSHFNLI